MSRSIVILGPQGSGKTRFAAQIAAHYGLSRVIEVDRNSRPNPPLQHKGDLALTYQEKIAEHLEDQGLKVVRISEALIAIGIGPVSLEPAGNTAVVDAGEVKPETTGSGLGVPDMALGIAPHQSNLEKAEAVIAARIETFQDEIIDMHAGLTYAQQVCHDLAVSSGWWNRRKPSVPVAAVAAVMESMAECGYPVGGKLTPEEISSQVPEKLCLSHSELSEAMEGHRKGLMDDHLPHRSMLEVELADAVIRIFDLGGAMELDIAGAIIEKLAYNQQRADHKPENREKAGGKSF